MPDRIGLHDAPPTPVSLEIAAEPRFAALVAATVESAARTFGLAEREGRALTLAAEEIFAYVAGLADAPRTVRLEMRDLRYAAVVRIAFEAVGFDPRLFNMTQRLRPDEDEALDALGLLIASRSVDRLEMERLGARGLRVTLSKDRRYPPAAAVPAVPASRGETRLVALTPPLALVLGGRIAASVEPAALPADLRVPDRVADMVAGGAMAGLAALDAGDGMAGGIVWRPLGSRNVEFHGPYLLEGAAGDLGIRLVEGCLEAIAKSDAVGLLTRHATPALPAAYFEVLGAGTGAPAWYRELQEDSGAAVWADAGVESFLRAEYDRLALAREIRPVSLSLADHPPHSVLAADVDRARGHVTLRPVWPGRDAAENIAEHVRLLSQEGIADIAGEIDLGLPWQAAFVAGYLAAGFRPAVVLPFGGERDLLVLRRTEPAA